MEKTCGYDLCIKKKYPLLGCNCELYEDCEPDKETMDEIKSVIESGNLDDLKEVIKRIFKDIDKKFN